MATSYGDAGPSVRDLVAEIIPAWHPDLATARIEFVFVDPTPMKDGRPILGRARKITGLNAYLSRGARPGTPPYFVIEIAESEWALMEEPEQRALLDHELSHCFVDEEGDLSTVPHDVEEFTAVLARHGAWRPDLTTFLEAGRQLTLDQA